MVTYEHISESCEIKPNLDCNYTVEIDLAPNGILFRAESIGKVSLHSKLYFIKKVSNIDLFGSLNR